MCINLLHCCTLIQGRALNLMILEVFSSLNESTIAFSTMLLPVLPGCP